MDNALISKTYKLDSSALSRAVTAGALLIAISVGCSQKIPTGDISGKVTAGGVPIAQGMIAFIGQQGKVVSGNIKDGAYSVKEMEVGPDAAVTVTSHPPSPMMQPPTGQQLDGQPLYPKGMFIRIPDRYGDSKLSDLTYEVVEGTQTHDIDLKP